MMKSMLPTYVDDRNWWCGMFLLLVCMMGVVYFILKYIFFYAGENLTQDIRNQLYKNIIYKHLAWFDRKDRAPGILSNVLSEDIGYLNGLTTEHLAILIEAYGGLIIGTIFAMFYTWKMGLVCLVLVPFVSFGGLMTSKLAWKTKANKASNVEKSQEEDPYEKSNALLSDIIMNYRTVIGFGEKNVEFLLDKFDRLLDEPNKTGIKNAHLTGFYFGYSQCVRFLFIGIAFYIAAVFIHDYDEDQRKTYIGLYVLFLSALGTGISLSSAPSVAKAKSAAISVFGIIDDKSIIDTRDKDGEKEIKKGEIELVNADFQYPSRNSKVLN
jgi:ATP-binding cassette, subfamily B (MDR/TAP), member 1